MASGFFSCRAGRGSQGRALLSRNRASQSGPPPPHLSRWRPQTQVLLTPLPPTPTSSPSPTVNFRKVITNHGSPCLELPPPSPLLMLSGPRGHLAERGLCDWPPAASVALLPSQPLPASLCFCFLGPQAPPPQGPCTGCCICQEALPHASLSASDCPRVGVETRRCARTQEGLCGQVSVDR